jgi:hypothetical protein
MPVAPFGLGYGLGVMGNAIPTQMNQRQNEALMTQMRGLQLQQMQRQEAQEEAMQQAAQSVPPETETVPTFETQTEQMPAAMTPQGLPLASAGTIPIQKQVQTGTVTRAKTYTTPYQAAAYRYGAMADYLFKQGMVEPAMRLQQQAQQASQMHQTTALGQAARMASIGNYGDATKLLNGLGMNLTGMSQSTDDPDTVQIHSTQNGQPVVADIPKQFIGAMIEDPAKAAQSIGMLNWRMASVENAKIRATAYAKGQESLVQHRRDLAAHYERMDNRAQKAFGGSYNALPAAQKNAIWYAKLHGISEKDASDLFVPGASRNTVTSAKALNALAQVNKQIITRYGGTLPDANSQDEREKADYALYTKNQDEIAKIGQEMASERGKKSVSSATPTETPKQNYEGEISPSGAYKFSGGKWIPNK